MIKRLSITLLAFAAWLAATALLPAAAESILLASTTSVDNSGLLGKILPVFTKETGIEVKVLALGTGQAIDTARRGDADLLLVHDPEAEDAFAKEGHVATRREIAWNDFVIVGDAADPAGIKREKDVLAALRDIWNRQAPFVTRGDKSGTDALEKRLWKAAGLDIAKAGPWYKDIGGGMGAALNTSAAMAAYTLSDRGTWLSFGNRQHLPILFAGDARLLNVYDVITLDPKLHAGAKLGPAKRLADWLVSAEGQQQIASYVMGGEKLFHPNADPKPHE
jgi:tungstate transport system substrate-binding protein